MGLLVGGNSYAVLDYDQGPLAQRLNAAYIALRDFQRVCDVPDLEFRENLADLVQHLSDLKHMMGVT